jgi:hypothetical protein
MLPPLFQRKRAAKNDLPEKQQNPVALLHMGFQESVHSALTLG